MQLFTFYFIVFIFGVFVENLFAKTLGSWIWLWLVMTRDA